MQRDQLFAEVARLAVREGLVLVQIKARVRELALGGRYALFRKASNHFLYANNDLEQVRGWIASR